MLYVLSAVLGHVLQYGDYLLEIGLLGVVVYTGSWRRLAGVSLYLISLSALDVVIRPVVLYRFGFASSEYWYTYWLSNVGLQLAAFLLVCSFFRSACSQNQQRWQVLRLALPMVFVLAVGISVTTIWRNYGDLGQNLITGVAQDLYFACLVLNTVLFVMMQYFEVADDRLPLLVCGLGLQFAGPAAGMALLSLTHQSPNAGTLAGYIEQLCSLGMLLTWWHAVKRSPRQAALVSKGGVAVQRAAA